MTHAFGKITALAFAAMLTASAAGADLLESLVRNSPFGVPPVAPAPAADGQPLEFRGVFADGGEYFFSIHDPATRSSHWVALNEPGLSFVLRSYDADKQTVVANHQGRSLMLVLKKAPAVASSPSAVAMPPLPPGPVPAVAPVESPPEEAARLAAIATEIRRRRELRQKPQAMEPPPAGRP